MNALFGWLGRVPVKWAYEGETHLSSVWRLYQMTLYWVFLGPFREKTRYRAQAFPLMDAVGIKSVLIVAIVNFLIGATLVLQTGDVLARYGQTSKVPGLVAVAMASELGPLMTAILVTGRVGAAFTASLGTMAVSEEILALETMGINPVGYLIAPRFIAIVLMLPCLTVFAVLIGMCGGWVAGLLVYHIETRAYWDTSITGGFLMNKDLISGLVKSFVFAQIICMISCYMAFIVEGGSESVGRNTMVSVVNTLVTIIFADLIFTMAMVQFFPR